MWSRFDPATCSLCGEPVTGSCIVCDKLFCARHLIVRKGVPNCTACEELRRVQERAGGISDADEARVVGLLLQDLARTVGPGQEGVVEESAARIRLFSDNSDFEQRVVDDVQQHLHDTFVDTTWPGCPDHPHHPLWYSDKWWTCAQTGKRVAPLGELVAKHDT